MGSNKIRKAFIFPGQGSQFQGMGKDFYSNRNAREIYAMANDILEYDITKLSFEGTLEEISQTIYTQPLIYIYSTIIDLELKRCGIYPFSVAGHSLGEISALASAGIISFEDGLNIIKVRAKSMHDSGGERPGKMIAVLKSEKNKIDRAISSTEGTVVYANINSDDQVVLSGDSKSIDHIEKELKKIKCRVIPLSVSGAFHSPLMKSAREPIKNIINSVNFNSSKVGIYQNFNASIEFDIEIIKENLIKQLESTVLWKDTIINMNTGIHDFYEVGPKKVLTNLNKKIIPQAITTNISTIDNLEEYAV